MFFRSLQTVWLALMAALAVALMPMSARTVIAADLASAVQKDSSADVLPLPPLKARVTDLTGTLNPQQRTALEARLAALEAAKGAQVAVLLAPTFQPESIEQYGIRLAEAWQLGRKGIDDGVILLIAKDDRQMRIEVGYGLEGALNDATAKRIISEVITPHFQAGDYYAGIDAGVNAIQTVIEGEPLPTPDAATSRRHSGSPGDSSLFLPLLAVAAVLAQGLNRLLGLGGSLLAAGAVAAIGGWLLGSWAGGLFLGFLALIFSLLRGGHGMGGMGSGGMGGLGGGGFSGGGGGGFGGGGASGRW